jgi:hypothetical protein
VVRELDVVGMVGVEIMESGEGSFQGTEGRAPGRAKGKERAREPDHRMWAVRTLCLKEGKDGTGGEDDYQVSYGGSSARRAVISYASYWRRSTMMGRSLGETG